MRLKNAVFAGAFCALALTIPANAAAPDGRIVSGIPARRDVRDLGRAPAALPISLSVVLNYRNEAQLDQLIALQSDPDSPMYGHFLTNAQFDAAYAPSQSDYAAVAGTLVRAGFHIDGNEGRTLVHVTAPTAVAARFFRTEFHTVLQAGHAGVRYVNARPATMPADLAGRVSSVVGFDTLTHATTDHVFLPRPVSVDKLPNKLVGPDGGYGPFAVAQAFDYPVQHGFDGKGHAIAIAIDYDSSDSDLRNFAAYFGIKRTGRTFHVPVDGGSPFDPSGSVETMLDVETVGTLDPGADVYTYDFGSAFTFQEISDAYAKIVTDNKVDVVNSSFGLCENDSPKSFENAVNAATKQGASKGITFVASTGDFSRGGKCNDGTGQDVPAVLPYFTSVGGVDLTVDKSGKLVSEPEDSGSGGGPSDIFPIPSYQVGVKGIFSKTKRNIPDVSGPYQPDSFYIGGAFAGPIGGTSWAAPATAAFVAERNQINGKRLGFANPTLYAAFKKYRYRTYNDITQGNNDIACTIGYDDCSGIGTLKAYALARVLK